MRGAHVKNRRALFTERAWIFQFWLLKPITGRTQCDLQLMPTSMHVAPARSVIATQPPSYARLVHHAIQSHYPRSRQAMLDLLETSIRFFTYSTLVGTLIDTCMLLQWNPQTGALKRGILLLGGIYSSLLLGTVHSQHGTDLLILDGIHALGENVSRLFCCGDVADADQLVHVALMHDTPLEIQ